MRTNLSRSGDNRSDCRDPRGQPMRGRVDKSPWRSSRRFRTMAHVHGNAMAARLVPTRPRRVRFMSQRFYSDARLYDRLFPVAEPAVEFYRAEADRQGGCVLELGCGTGHKLIPIASDGHPCTGLDLSSEMLTEAQRKADMRGLTVEWVPGDMRDFDLGRTFDLVFIAANSLLHLHEAADLLSCFRAVRAQLAPGGRFIFDVFNPNMRLLADADGVRRTREVLSFV